MKLEGDILTINRIVFVFPNLVFAIKCSSDKLFSTRRRELNN